MFVVSVRSVVGDGAETLLWLDRWLHGKSSAEFAPNLVSSVPNRIRNIRTVQGALADNQWLHDVRGVLSLQAFYEFFLCWDMLQGFHLGPGIHDQHV
jgi:hypothetical protein